MSSYITVFMGRQNQNESFNRIVYGTGYRKRSTFGLDQLHLSARIL